MSKERIDLILLNKGLFESREKAKASIMAGIVFVNGERVEKPGTMFPPDCDIEIKGNLIPYVSRGGLKLAKAIEEFEINLTDLVCVDVGASTRGFTDVKLQNGARKVFFVDVGYGELAWELRKDPRVICMERTNFRYVTDEHIPEPLDFGAVDVAFISLKLILPPLKKLLKPHGKVVCLIKPQFEAGKDKVGKKGVVKDPEVHREVIENIIKIATELGFSVLDLSYSPITGPEGNIEYLLYLNNNESDQLSNLHELIFNTVENSHKNLS